MATRTLKRFSSYLTTTIVTLVTGSIILISASFFIYSALYLTIEKKGLALLIGLSGLLVLGLSVTISFFLSRQLGRPLGEMATKAIKISEGNKEIFFGNSDGKFLVQCRNPGPQGQVRVQRLCPLYDSMLLNGIVVPTTYSQGVTNESISKINTNHLALPISHCMGAEISVPDIGREGRNRSIELCKSVFRTKEL